MTRSAVGNRFATDSVLPSSSTPTRADNTYAPSPSPRKLLAITRYVPLTGTVHPTREFSPSPPSSSVNAAGKPGPTTYKYASISSDTNSKVTRSPATPENSHASPTSPAARRPSRLCPKPIARPSVGSVSIEPASAIPRSTPSRAVSEYAPRSLPKRPLATTRYVPLSGNVNPIRALAAPRPSSSVRAVSKPGPTTYRYESISSDVISNVTSSPASPANPQACTYESTPEKDVSDKNCPSAAS